MNSDWKTILTVALAIPFLAGRCGLGCCVVKFLQNLKGESK
jgi:hypothetical protein